MADYKPEQLTEVEEFAYLYMEKKEISIIAEINIEDLDDQQSAAGIAFLTGRLKRKAQYHKNITRLSDQLSSPAQAIESKLAANIYLNDKKR